MGGTLVSRINKRDWIIREDNGALNKTVGDKVTFEENSTDKIYYTYGGDGNLVSMDLDIG